MSLLQSQTEWSDTQPYAPRSQALVARTSTSRVPFLYSALICDGSTLSGKRNWRRAKADERSERCTLHARAALSAGSRGQCPSKVHTPPHQAVLCCPVRAHARRALHPSDVVLLLTDCDPDSLQVGCAVAAKQASLRGSQSARRRASVMP